MKQYQTRYDFKIEKNDGSIRVYYVKIQGRYVEVTKDVFEVFYNSYHREYRSRKNDMRQSLSLDSINGSNYALSDVIGTSIDIIQKINKDFMIDKIKEVLESLDEVSQVIAELSLFNEFSDEKIAKYLNIKRRTVAYKKLNIKKMIQKELENIEEWR